MDFLKRFWAALLSLGALVSFYFAVLPQNYEWVFWTVVGVALMVAVTTKVAPMALDWAQRVRNYPALLEAAGRAKADAEALATRLREANDKVQTEWVRGVEEGRRSVIGAILADQAPVIPRIVAVMPVEDGYPVLSAAWPHQVAVTGARFLMKTRASGTLRGIVEVVEVDEMNDRAILMCVEATAPAFWQHLADRAPVSEEPPRDIELVPPPIDFQLSGRPDPLDAVMFSSDKEED